MFTQTQLRQRGWSPKLIETYLGDPDQIERNPIYPGKGSPMKLWKDTRVVAAEQCPEFLAYQTKRAKASARSKAVAEKKRQRLLSEVSAIDFHVARWPLPKLMRAAIAEWEQMGVERGEYDRCGADADESTKNRWAVNFVRHSLVSIGAGQHLPLMRGQTGITQAEAVLENKIYETIADVYPELASAAFHQADRLWGQVVLDSGALVSKALNSAGFSEVPSASAKGCRNHPRPTRLRCSWKGRVCFLRQQKRSGLPFSALAKMSSARCCWSSGLSVAPSPALINRNCYARVT